MYGINIVAGFVNQREICLVNDGVGVEWIGMSAPIYSSSHTAQRRNCYLLYDHGEVVPELW